MSSSETVEVAGTILANASARCVPFMDDNPRVRLTIIENALSQIPNISERSKFRVLSTKLPQKLLTQCADILLVHPYEDGIYDKLKESTEKERKCTEDNQDERLSTVFDKLEIGDRQPSEFFRLMQSKAAGLGLPNDILINRLMQQVPLAVQQTIFPWKEETTEKFLALADRCWDLQRNTVQETAADNIQHNTSFVLHTFIPLSTLEFSKYIFVQVPDRYINKLLKLIL